MLETGAPAWPLPPLPAQPLPPTAQPCQRTRRDVQARLRNYCSSFFPRALPARIPQKLPQAASGEHRFAHHLAAAANRCAPRARAPRAKTPGKSKFSREARAKIFTICKANSNTSARSAERNFLHAIAERTNDANKEKTNEKMRAFPPPHEQPRRGSSRKNASVSPCPTAASEEKIRKKTRAFPPANERPRRESIRKNASVSPAPRPPAKRKEAKKCERFPCPTAASEEKTSEKMRAFPLANGRPRRESIRKNASVSPAQRPPAKRKEAKKRERFPLRTSGRKRRNIPEHARRALAPDFSHFLPLLERCTRRAPESPQALNSLWIS